MRQRISVTFATLVGMSGTIIVRIVGRRITSPPRRWTSWFFPNLKSHEIKNLLEFGDVKALFMGKVENWDEIKNGVDNEMPVIAFPHYEGNSKIDRGYQWNDFINQFEAQKENYHPNIDDIWTIIFTKKATRGLKSKPPVGGITFLKIETVDS